MLHPLCRNYILGKNHRGRGLQINQPSLFRVECHSESTSQRKKDMRVNGKNEKKATWEYLSLLIQLFFDFYQYQNHIQVSARVCFNQCVFEIHKNSNFFALITKTGQVESSHSLFKQFLIIVFWSRLKTLNARKN